MPEAAVTDTISGAAKRLGAMPTPPAPEAREEPAAPEQRDTRDTRDTQNSPPPENAGPGADQPTGETQEQAEPAQEPPIEPPASWDDEAKARFGKLPREDQEYLAQRERDRDLALRRGQDETAKERKAIEAQRAEAVQQAQQYVQHFQMAAQALHQQLLGDFPDIKTPADLAKLAAEDPARYLVYDARQKQVQDAYQQVAQHNQVAQRQQQAKLNEWIESEARKLADLVPEWKDGERASREIREVREHAIKVGLPPDQANQPWSAAAAVMARESMLYRRGLQAVTKAKLENLPKVVRPGTAAAPGEAERTRAEAARKAHSKNGSVDSAADALRALRRAPNR